MTTVRWLTPDAVCKNCREDCKDPTRWSHFADEVNRCMNCPCRDFEAENPE